MEAIDRTFGILELFLDHEDTLGITELSKLSGLSPSVTHRIATALLKKGYLIQKEKKGKYSLGFKFLDYSYALRTNIKIANIAYPFLLNLSKEANESVNLTILDGGEILVIARVEVGHDLRVSGEVGKRAPLYCTASGKLFLSQMPEAERRLVFNDPAIEKFTPNTITDFREMEKELELFKIEGCTFDREEVGLGIWSVAAPVYDISGKIEAGVAILAPTARINDQRASSLISLTKSCASMISREMGYRR